MDAKSILRKHKNRARIIIALVLIGVLTTIFSSLPMAVKIILAALFFMFEVLSLILLIKRTVDPLLNDQLNPKLYYEVYCALHKKDPYALAEITMSYYTYSYDTTERLCKDTISRLKPKQSPLWYKLFLARMCFDRGDIAGLRTLCEEFHNVFMSNQHARLFYGPIMKFYSMFCDGEYEQCCEFYAQRRQEKLYSSGKLAAVQLDYGYAVACYRSGDLEQARQYFDHIVQEAPMLNFAKIAKRYLNAMDTDCDVILVDNNN